MIRRVLMMFFSRERAMTWSVFSMLPRYKVIMTWLLILWRRKVTGARRLV